MNNLIDELRDFFVDAVEDIDNLNDLLLLKQDLIIIEKFKNDISNLIDQKMIELLMD